MDIKMVIVCLLILLALPLTVYPQVKYMVDGIEERPNKPLLKAPVRDENSRNIVTSLDKSGKTRLQQVDATRFGQDKNFTLDIAGEQVEVVFKSWRAVGQQTIWRGNIERTGEEAVFTLHRAGVVGSITLDGQSYQLFPVGKKGNHILIKQKKNRNAKKSMIAKLNKNNRNVLRKHEQLRIASSMKANHFSLHPDGSVTKIRNANKQSLGEIRDGKLVFNERTQDALMLTGDEVFALIKGSNTSPRYQQVIDGIKVDRLITVGLKQKSKEIRHLVGIIVGSDTAIQKFNSEDVDLEEARVLAQEALKLDQESTTLDGLRIISEQLVYRYNENDKLAPYYKFEFSYRGLTGRNHIAFVNAKTREAVSDTTDRHAARTCVEGLSQVDSCNDPEAVVVIAENGSCTHAGWCGMTPPSSVEAGHRTAKETVDQANADWSGILGHLAMNDQSIEIVANDSVNGGQAQSSGDNFYIMVENSQSMSKKLLNFLGSE
jgi:hypothetical protein